jgi:hypothetical protein
MADAAGFSAFPSREIAPYADLQDELPAREHRLFYPEVETLDAEIAHKINIIESV